MKKLAFLLALVPALCFATDHTIHVDFAQGTPPSQQFPLSFSGVWNPKARHVAAVIETQVGTLHKNSKRLYIPIVAYGGVDTVSTKGTAGFAARGTYQLLDNVDIEAGIGYGYTVDAGNGFVILLGFNVHFDK